MSAQERDALDRAAMEVLQCHVQPVCDGSCNTGVGPCNGEHEECECYEHEDPERVPFTGDVCWFAESVVDALLAAGWTRPVTAGGEVEAATDDVIERAAKAIADYELGDYAEDERTPSDWTIWLGTARALADAGLLAGGVPGRSEGEIKAEAWDEGVAAGDDYGRMYTSPDPDDWPESPPVNPYRAARVAGTTEAGDE